MMFRNFFKTYICFCASLLGWAGGFAMAQNFEPALSKVERAKELARLGVNINATRADLRTQWEGLVKYVNINAKDRQGRTALHHLAENGEIEAVKVATQLGAKIHTKDALGRTALHYAAMGGHTPVIKYLIEFASVLHPSRRLNVRDQDGKTVLHYLAANGEVEVVKTAVELGAKIHIRDALGRSPLHLAAKDGHTPVVEVLIESGAKVNTKDFEASSPLHHAAKNKHVGTITKLIEAGTDLNARDHRGRTALHIAAHYGYIEIAEVLIEAGADIHIKDKKDSNGQVSSPYFIRRDRHAWTALNYAVYFKNIVIAEMLADRGAKINPIGGAVASAEWEALLKPVSFKTSTETTEKVNSLPLAARFGQIESVKALSEAGADLNARDELGNTALHIAARFGQIELAKALIELGIDINAQNGRALDLDTALFVAIDEEQDEIAIELIRAGADWRILSSIISPKGWTALHAAARRGQTAVVEEIIKAGAKINETDTEGNTALSIAKKFGNQETVQKLEELLGGDTYLYPGNGGDDCRAVVASLRKNIGSRKVYRHQQEGQKEDGRAAERPVIEQVTRHSSPARHEGNQPSSLARHERNQQEPEPQKKREKDIMDTAVELGIGAAIGFGAEGAIGEVIDFFDD